MLKRIRLLVLGTSAVSCALIAACATPAAKFKPEELSDSKGAFLGRIQVFNHGEDITSTCYVNFTEKNGERKLYTDLDASGWVFGAVAPGDTYIASFNCNRFSIPATPIVVGLADLKFPVPGHGKVTYFGNLVFRVNRIAGSLLGSAFGDFGSYGALQPGERLITVEDQYGVAAKEYRDRYGAADSLAIVDATTPWPVTFDCPKLQKTLAFALKNHYSVSAITPELSERASSYFLRMFDPTSKVFSPDERTRIKTAITKQLQDKTNCDSLEDIRSIYVAKVKESVIHAPIIDAVENAQQEPFNALVLAAAIHSFDTRSAILFDANRVNLDKEQPAPVLPVGIEPTLKYQTVERNGKKSRIGVIALGSLTSGTTEKVRSLLEQAKSELLLGLVLDLSSSPGGLANEMKSLIGLFVGQAPVYAFKNRTGLEQVSSPAGTAAYTGALGVIIGQETSSGAETIAGSLQDLHRALLVGSKTLGEAGIGTQVSIAPGRFLKLTIAMTYLPSGRSPQRTGVTPDIRVETPKEHPKKGAPLPEGSLPVQENILAFVPANFTKELVSSDEIDRLQKDSDLRSKLHAKQSRYEASLEVFADWFTAARR